MPDYAYVKDKYDIADHDEATVATLLACEARRRGAVEAVDGTQK